MSELKTLAAIAVSISLIVGCTALFIFNIPLIYSFVLTLATGVMFFFIILWSSYLFIFK